LTPETSAVVRATVVSIETGGPHISRHGKTRPPLKLLVRDDTGALEIVFFGVPYLANAFRRGEEYVFYGAVTQGARALQMLHPDFSRADEGGGRDILPVYPLVAGLRQRDLRKWTEALLASACRVPECLPADTIARNNLCGAGYALENIHYPADMRRLREAKYRLVFEELLALQTGLLMLKGETGREGRGIAFKGDADTMRFIETLPFSLTGAQRRTLAEIEKDMESARVMNRLVQGDVGSGKTVVAAASMYKAVKSGYQAVIMAPTETLAKQHLQEFERLFRGHGVRIGFLSGTVKGNERR
jgi:ATP-dependent DNA helicase RecG